MRDNEIARLVLISLKNKYVYFPIPKNASSTIKHHLQNLEYLGSPYSAKKVHDPRYSPLLATYQLPVDLLEEALSSEKYNRFVVVRHPVTRLLSCYLDRIQRGQTVARRRVSKWLKVDIDAPITLHQFVQAICEHDDSELEKHFRLQTDFIAYPDISITTVVRFERMREELPELFLKLGMEELPSTDESFSPPATDADSKIRQHYDDKLLSMVQERYKRDMEAFGYDRIKLSD